MISNYGDGIDVRFYCYTPVDNNSGLIVNTFLLLKEAVNSYNPSL